MSPRNGVPIRDPGSAIGDPFSNWAGNDNTSVGALARRYCALSLRLWESVTSATATSPRAADGATCRNQRDKPPSRSGRPRPSVTVTCRSGPRRPRTPERRTSLLSGSTVRFVRLDDLLHERMPHHVLLVEMNERDALDVANHLHGLDEARLARRRQIDLRDVSSNDGF